MFYCAYRNTKVLIVAEKDVTVLLTIIHALFACIYMFY